MSVVDKFLDYVSFETTSDENSESCPSTPGQMVLAKHLAEQLNQIGLDNAFVDENGYVYAYLPGNCEGKTIGLVSHMDTSNAVSGKDIKTRIIENYNGQDIVLSEGILTTVERFPNLKDYIGKSLIVTDGKTLLGGDDKAGIAEIIEIVEFLINHPQFKHAPIRVCFTPDEEIGRGTDKFDVENFKVDFAYTLDGGKPDEIMFECFNAAAARVKIKGVSTHPGDGKDRMINALNVAHEFHSFLPVEARPEHTEGYEGFNSLMEMSGSVEEATLSYIIRNHDKAKLEQQKQDFIKAAESLNRKYGQRVEVVIKDQYQNMLECFKDNKEPIELVQKAMRKLNIDYKEIAIRGGTDGAMLSYKGILCPNLGTGTQNCHGINEFACIEDMNTMIQLILEIITLATK